MKKLIRILFCLFVCGLFQNICLGQQVTFERIFARTPCLDRANSMMQTNDGGYLLVGGTSESICYVYNPYLIKTNAHGDTIWTKVLNYRGFSEAVVELSNGELVFAGFENIGGNRIQMQLIKTDNIGNEIWMKYYGPVDHDTSDYAYDLKQTFDNGFITLGNRSYDFGYSDMLLFKIDSLGNLQWSKTYGGSGKEYGNSLVIAADSNYVLCGQTEPIVGFPTSDVDIYLIKANLQGDTIWTKTFGWAGYEIGESVDLTIDGGFIIAGSTTSFGSGEALLLKTDANGVLQWYKRFPNGSRLYSVKLSPDGGFIATGYSKVYANTGYDLYILKTDSNGNILWETRFDSRMNDGGNKVVLTSDGGYAIAGETSVGATNYSDIYFIKTDSLGAACANPILDFNFWISEDTLLLINNSLHGISWLWDFGDGDTSHAKEPFHIYSSPGLYDVCLVSSDTCGADTLCKTIGISEFPPIADFLCGIYDSSGCELFIIDQSLGYPFIWQWNMGDGTTYSTPNVSFHTYANPGTYNISLIVINGVGSDTAYGLITVDSFQCFCFSDTSALECGDTLLGCVWPGDADDNGIANIQDVLPIGIGYGDTFATRPNASTNWIGQPMQDWTQNFSLIGTNYKHADCNGDGVIDSFDFQPILDNYGLVHFKGSGAQKTGIPLYLEVQPGAFTAGSTVSVDVLLGTQTMQIPDFYAIAFSVLYNGAVVQPGSVTIDLNNSWAGTKSVDLMGIHKEFSAQGRVDIGVTRIDKANRAGYGRITRINYILIDDIAGKDAMELATLSPWVIEAKAIRNDETEIELFLSVEDDNVTEKISLYPNPAEDILFVEIPASLQAEFVRVYDSIGKEIMRINEPVQKISISTENFPEGIYYMEVRSKQGKAVTKFAIAK